MGHVESPAPTSSTQIFAAVNNALIRQFEKLEFRDPQPFLVKLRGFELEVARTETAEKIRTLRTNALKDMRELREAAIFCFLMGQRIGHTVYLAPGESQDYDFVASWYDGEVRTYAPVQLKELVPKHVNPSATLEHVIASLQKYADSRDLAVAVHLNQQREFDFRDIRLPALKIGSLWFFGALSQDHLSWGLWGDFLKSPIPGEYLYPTR
jgi:hypothetical protein